MVINLPAGIARWLRICTAGRLVPTDPGPSVLAFGLLRLPGDAWLIGERVRTTQGKTMKKKFPKKIYVKYWQDTDGQWYLSAEERAEKLATDVGDRIHVGVYELVDHGETVSTPMFWLKGVPKPKAHR